MSGYEGITPRFLLNFCFYTIVTMIVILAIPVIDHLFTEGTGKIEKKYTELVRGSKGRYYTRYNLKLDSGYTMRISSDLYDKIKVGDHIEKQSWSFTYRINGISHNVFYGWVPYILLGSPIIGLLLAFKNS